MLVILFFCVCFCLLCVCVYAGLLHTCVSVFNFVTLLISLPVGSQSTVFAAFCLLLLSFLLSVCWVFILLPDMGEIVFANMFVLTYLIPKMLVTNLGSPGWYLQLTVQNPKIFYSHLNKAQKTAILTFEKLKVDVFTWKITQTSNQ